MGFEELAKIIANGFKKIMEEEGFETFKEMQDCYWWTSNDIKEEVCWYIREASENSDYLMFLSDDGGDVYIEDDCISYRKFAIMWRKALA